MSLRGKVRAHKTSLTPPSYTVHVPEPGKLKIMYLYKDTGFSSCFYDFFNVPTESINQSIGCQYCRAKGRQPRFNAQVALHNYVNKIIRDTVPQKNLLGNVEITVIRVCFIFITSLFSQANDWSFLTAFPCRKRVKIGIFPVTYFKHLVA